MAPKRDGGGGPGTGVVLAISCLLASVPILGGCVWPGSTPATLALESLGDDPKILSGDFQTALYGHDERGTSFIVSDVSADRLASGDFTDAQVIHVVLLWRPKAGATPMDATATNASVRHVVFSGGEVGIYGGTGFMLPGGRLGKSLRLDIQQATLTLLESTDGFVDLLGAARLTGTLTADHAPSKTRRLYFNLCQRVTDTLGRSRFVDADRVDLHRPYGASADATP